MVLYNINNISEVYMVKECPCPYIKLKHGKEGFWPWKQKEWTAYNVCGDYVDQKNIHAFLFEDNNFQDVYIKEDGTVYEKARIVLLMNNGTNDYIYCDSNEDAEKTLINIYNRNPELRTKDDLTGKTINNR